MENEIKQRFANVLVRLRKEKGISQQNLATLCDLERAYISRLERALVQPSLTTIVKIADALKVNPSFIVSEFESENLT
ncbi:MAG: helix-turn-helix transcriptional regulator [Reichenbachiella sp.]|uniref:helix-turn-helix domain-containing protein n=1 Tax=Reichenbachiella sp. TaxID=2184521 RepID=UPI003263A312